jgi:HAD superfamily hydrolase (TIGR01509 family)
MTETAVRCIIFDFGGVIGFFDFDRAWARFAAMTSGRFDTGQIRDAIEISGLRDAYERGEISTSTFLAVVRERLRLTVSPGDITEAWSEIFTPNKPVIDLIQKLRVRYRLVLGSNTNELHYKQFRRQFASALDLFSEEILSYQIQVKKPDNAFYAACMRVAGCEAAACIYIDDVAEFVASARAFGIKGIVYNNTLNLVEALNVFKVQAD